MPWNPPECWGYRCGPPWPVMTLTFILSGTEEWWKASSFLFITLIEIKRQRWMGFGDYLVKPFILERMKLKTWGPECWSVVECLPTMILRSSKRKQEHPKDLLGLYAQCAVWGNIKWSKPGFLLLIQDAHYSSSYTVLYPNVLLPDPFASVKPSPSSC